MLQAVRIMANGDLYAEHIPEEGRFPLQGFQEMVGGSVEGINFGHLELNGYCDEEGKLAGKPGNLRATLLWHFGTVFTGRVPLVADVLVGDIVIVGPTDIYGEDTNAPAWLWEAAWKEMCDREDPDAEVETLMCGCGHSPFAHMPWGHECDGGGDGCKCNGWFTYAPAGWVK